MNLVRDVLDQQVIDCEQRKSGKVDGIALEIREGEAPRVAYLDIGPNVLARRLSRRLERMFERMRGLSNEFRVPWSKIEHADISVNLTIDASHTPAFTVENWLRDHVITRIPGNAHQKHQEKHD
jgi:hypothetical protein